MKVTAATLKKLVREAVEECYGGNMDEKKHEDSSLEEQAKTSPEASAASAADPVAAAMRAGFAGRSLAGGAAPTHMPGESAAGPEASAGSVRTDRASGRVVARESLNRLIKTLVSEALKEQGSWSPRSAPRGADVPLPARRGAAAPQARPAAEATPPADMTFKPEEVATTPSVPPPSAPTKESLNRLIKRLVSEVIKEQGPSWAPRGAAPVDTYVGGGAAPAEAEEMRRAVAAGYYDAAGNITPSGRDYISRRAAELQAQMVDAYRRTGRMPVEISGTTRGGIAGLDASARRTAARRATAAIRDLGTETGAERVARRTAGGTDAMAAMSTPDFNTMISGLAAGAPVPGSARPTATASAARPSLSDAMRALAAQRRLEAERNRGSSGGPAPVVTPASLGLASAGSTTPTPSTPAAVRPRSVDRSLDALASTPSGDPLEGLPSERLAEMVRRAVRNALKNK